MTNALERLHVQSGITLQGIMQSPSVLGKSRWVKNNQVIDIIRIVKEFERIITECLMPFIAREVQFHIGIGEFNGLGAAIHGMNQLCPTPHGIERKASGITEHVQYPLVFGVPFQ